MDVNVNIVFIQAFDNHYDIGIVNLRRDLAGDESIS